MFLWKRYQRTARTRRKGKAASDFDLVRYGHGDVDENPLPGDKKSASTGGLDWMKAVRKSSLKENNATAAGDADRPENRKSLSAENMKESGGGSSSTSRFKLPKFSDSHRFSASTAALAIPIPKNATAPAAGPNNTSNFSTSNKNNNSKSNSTSVPASSLPAATTTVASQIRSYHGPPPRFTGGSSTWREPSTRGVLCRAVFSHKPDEFDELLMKRGDYVVTDMFFEDGWTLCHIVDPLKYKIPSKSAAAAAAAGGSASSTNGSAAASAFARWRPKSSKNSSTVNLATSAPASSFMPPPAPASSATTTPSKKGKEVDPSYRSALAALMSHGSSSSSAAASASAAASDLALSEEITQLYASLNQPRDQTKSGVVPWHCLIEIDPDDIRLMQQRHAEAQLLTMTHQQMANKFAFAYR
ncbi:hypothetical protein HDU88_005573 [Geranomyces variabilis]|nr:hypothetical protein HDU88_005573 [Geranomyces variabilis]